MIEEIGEKLQLTGKYVLLILELPVQSSAIIAGCQSVSYTDTVPCNILTLPPLETPTPSVFVRVKWLIVVLFLNLTGYGTGDTE